MEAEARYTWVGAGVLVLVAALVASLMWLTSLGGAAGVNRYVIHFERQALDGLEIGGDVSLRGIKVGRVEDYALASNMLNRVRVEIRVDARTPVLTNTVAMVSRNFVTGVAQITLQTDEPAGGPLTAIPDGERFPLIGEGRSNLEAIAGQVTKVGDIAAETLNNLNQLLNADNRAAMGATLRHLRDLSATLNQRLAGLEKTMQQVGGATELVARAAGQVGDAASKLGQIGVQIAGVAQTGGQQLGQTLSQLDATLADARRTMQRVADQTEQLAQQATRSAKRLEDTAVNIDDQLGAAVAELRLSVEAGTRVIERLRDPRAALLGPAKSQLGPGETLP